MVSELDVGEMDRCKDLSDFDKSHLANTNILVPGTTEHRRGGQQHIRQVVNDITPGFLSAFETPEVKSVDGETLRTRLREAINNHYTQLLFLSSHSQDESKKVCFSRC